MLSKSADPTFPNNDAQNRRDSEPTFLCNGASVYPEKNNVSCKS